MRCHRSREPGTAVKTDWMTTTEAHGHVYDEVQAHGKALDATAWHRLIAAAGGTDMVAAYCAEQLAAATAKPSRSTGSGKSGKSAGNSAATAGRRCHRPCRCQRRPGGRRAGQRQEHVAAEAGEETLPSRERTSEWAPSASRRASKPASSVTRLPPPSTPPPPATNKRIGPWTPWPSRSNFSAGASASDTARASGRQVEISLVPRAAVEGLARAGAPLSPARHRSGGHGARPRSGPHGPTGSPGVW